MSSTIALNNMLSPSEMVRRIERARLPSSKSSYNQSSAFQMGISLCLAVSGLGFIMNSPPASGNPPCGDTLGSVARVEPLHQLRILQVSAQTAIDFDSGRLEKADKSVETRTHIGSLQGLKRAGKEAVGRGIHRTIGPSRQTCGLSAFPEVCSSLVLRTGEPFGVINCFRLMIALFANSYSSATKHGSGTSALVRSRCVREPQAR